MNTSTIPAVRPTSHNAIIALVSGILGWTMFPILGSLIAVIFGHMARAEISRARNMDGDGMALAGLILGYSSLVMMMLCIILLVLLLIGVIGAVALKEMSAAGLG